MVHRGLWAAACQRAQERLALWRLRALRPLGARREHVVLRPNLPLRALCAMCGRTSPKAMPLERYPFVPAGSFPIAAASALRVGLYRANGGNLLGLNPRTASASLVAHNRGGGGPPGGAPQAGGGGGGGIPARVRKRALVPKAKRECTYMPAQRQVGRRLR